MANFKPSRSWLMAQLVIVIQSRAKCHLFWNCDTYCHVFRNYTSVRSSQTLPLLNYTRHEAAQTCRCSVISHPWARWERTRAQSNCPVVPADQNASVFVIQSSFYALLPSLLCRLAVELFYGHLWIGSQLIYSQCVTGETSDMLFWFATNNNSSNDGGGGSSCLWRFQLLIETRQKPQSVCFSSMTENHFINSQEIGVPCFAG